MFSAAGFAADFATMWVQEEPSPKGRRHDSPGWSEAESWVGMIYRAEPASAGGIRAREMNGIVIRLIFFIHVLALMLGASATGQSNNASPQLLLENDFVRVSRITVPAKGDITIQEKSDAVLVRVLDETARFVPAGTTVRDASSGDQAAAELLVTVKKHWDVEMHPCSYPKQCVHETQMGGQTIAWTTTLFSNGFISAATHKLDRGGSLTSSYYTAKGTDKILIIPFTDLNFNYGGAEENLKPGEPYFGAGAEVEVNAKDAESRWFVLRINIPGQ
jgi:hypothetical protein